MSKDALPTHDETPPAVRLAQWFPTWSYGFLIGIALATGAATLWLADHPIVGAASAASSAIAAAGFVLHDRPRRLSKRWEDLYWDPDMEDLARQGLVGYESEATAVWHIAQAAHRKGRFPIVRLTERSDSSAPWSEFAADVQVSAKGDLTVLVGIRRSTVQPNREVVALIT